MKWFRIPKEQAEKPTKGGYKDWKELLAIESEHQCVYCTIHEGQFGGIRNFHIEHYRPKSKDEFKHLENDYDNLFFACSICNCFKGADWPNDPNEDLEIVCYPDPSKVDYSILFSTNKDFILAGSRLSSKYIIERLYLNRPQLIFERRGDNLSLQIENALMVIKNMQNRLKNIKDDLSKQYLSKICSLLVDISELLNIQNKIRPYEINQIKKHG